MSERPSKIAVVFPVEVEVRFDFIADAPPVRPILENVIPPPSREPPPCPSP